MKLVIASLICLSTIAAVFGPASAGPSSPNGGKARLGHTYQSPKFCNFILWDVEQDIVGIRRFIDALKARGLYDKTRLTLILHPDKAARNPAGQRGFFRQLYDDGNEIGVVFSSARGQIAQWLGIPESSIVTIGGQLFGDPDLEEQARATAAGFRAGANVCIEGDSFVEEMWDIPHNWEGAPFLPYWVQWSTEKPASTSRVNREMAHDKGILELQWSTRTLWQNYDRICLPMCFHLGEPVKQSQWRTGQLSKRGDIGWWKAEIAEYEANLDAGRAPLLYLNTASEGSIFTPGGDWRAFLDSDEALDCAMDLVAHLLSRGWNLTTVSEFVDYYQAHWPCPSAPSAIFFVKDTLAERPDRDGVVIPGHGRLLHAETKYFQICDHENRISPELVTAYDLQTPNLLRGGYTFGDPDKHSPGANKAQYAATSGNTLFWSPSEPLKDGKGVPYYRVNKPSEAKDRTFTLYLGDDWKPYQFAKGKISGVRRKGDQLFWTKEMASSVPGSDIRVKYQHRLDGPVHTVKITVAGEDAVGQAVHFRLCPYFHQGWDTNYNRPEDLKGVRVQDPLRVGQEHNVFAACAGKEFAFSDSNIAPRLEIIKPDAAKAQLSIFNRNPGLSPTDPAWTIDDNPDFNRGFTLTFDGAGSTVELVDAPGPGKYVTAVINLGKHTQGREYEFSFRYWKGEDRQE